MAETERRPVTQEDIDWIVATFADVLDRVEKALVLLQERDEEGTGHA